VQPIEFSVTGSKTLGILPTLLAAPNLCHGIAVQNKIVSRAAVSTSPSTLAWTDVKWSRVFQKSV